MLVLTRKKGEAVVIGDNIKVTLVSIRGNKVRLGFDAPEDTLILREELLKNEQSEEMAPETD